MKQISGKPFIAIALCLAASVLVIAQNSKKPLPASSLYVITAKAGGVNFVSGSISVVHQNGKTEALIKGSQLETGDKIKSSADGKAEILLNPGSFVRLAESSELYFVSNSLDDLQVKVSYGSAIFEVVATKDFRVEVKTPNSGFSIIKSGIYRVDVAENGSAKVEVWKGKAQLNNSTTATTLKGGQTSSIEEGQIAAVKFNRDDKDDFELWSKDRAKELAKLNDVLLNRQVNRSLISYSRGFGWNNGFGVWVHDPFSGVSCFLPYSYGYNSPYGYSYNQSVWGYQYTGNGYGNSQNNNIPSQPYIPNNPQTGGNAAMPPPPMNAPSAPTAPSLSVEPNRAMPSRMRSKGEPQMD